MAGFDISQLKGTPLYQLATNANVYGGKTLSKTEMVIFQQQCREMGFAPEKYGLEIVKEDFEGANAKETRKNQEEIRNNLDRAYKDQFGKKNIPVARDAETRAYSIINVAKEAFDRNHKGVDFVPENLGLRPNFMAPEYKDNLTKYVTDLNAWGQKVAEQYRNADSMTNEQLAAMVMQNSDENAVMNAEKIAAAAKTLANQAEDLAAETQTVVREEGVATRKAVHNEGAATRRAVHAEGAATRGAVHQEGAMTRRAVHVEGAVTRGVVHQEGAVTRANDNSNTAEIIDPLDPTGKARAIKYVRDQAAAAGKSAIEFIQENPELIIPQFGIPIVVIKSLLD